MAKRAMSWARELRFARLERLLNDSCRFLDATTLTAVRFLRQYPLGRLAVFGYIVFIHLFVYLLIHHLQQRAMHVEQSGLAVSVD